MNYAGKNVIITGGTRGIGRAVSAAFLEQGALVNAFYHSDDKSASDFLEEAEARVAAGEWTGRLSVRKVPVEDFSLVRQAVMDIKKEQQGIDFLINNAGIYAGGFFATMEQSVCDKMIDVNLKGPVNVSKAVVRIMMAQKSGHIINISSITGFRDFSGVAVYSATKAGIAAFTGCLAVELAGYNIIVNGLAPGLVETGLLKNMDEKIINEYKKSSGDQRLLTPGDVARWVIRLTDGWGINLQGRTIPLTGQPFAK